MIHTAVTVRVYTAGEIEKRLRPILATMDQAKAKANKALLIEAHHIYLNAASELHTMLAEVCE
jgi:hypothetical protein